jgi:predicted nuclease of predicted toxin-antitoxin system
MKILLDAQLPRSLVKQLEPMGCDVLHTLDLPEGNRSSDATIAYGRRSRRTGGVQ